VNNLATPIAPGDRRECEVLRTQIEYHVELAEIAYYEGRLREVTENLKTASAFYRAVRRLEKAIWHAALNELNEAGVLISNGGSS
jgi:hypothetical protein